MKSRRRVALPGEARAFLKPLRHAAKDPDGLVFRRAEGSLIDPDRFDEWFLPPVARKAGPKDVRFHDQGLCFASMLIVRGRQRCTSGTRWGT